VAEKPRQLMHLYLNLSSHVPSRSRRIKEKESASTGAMLQGCFRDGSAAMLQCGMACGMHVWKLDGWPWRFEFPIERREAASSPCVASDASDKPY
jgi:hypothetical protein